MFRTSTTFDPKTKYWSGIQTMDIFNNQITIGQILLYSTTNNPNKVIQISDDTGVCLTNNDIRVRSIQAAQFFQKLGFKEGDIVGFVARNSDNLAPLMIGAFLCGIIVNGISPTFKKDEITRHFIETKPKLIFCDDSNYPEIREFLIETNLRSLVYTVNKKLENLPFVTEFIHETDDTSVDEFEFPTLVDSKNTTGAIIYSSGSTGPPKAVCLSQASLLFSASNYLNRTSEDVIFTFSQSSMLTAYLTMFCSLLRGALKIITTKDFNPELLAKIINKYKVTFVYTLPSHLALLLHNYHEQKTDITSLRMYLVSGGNINKELIREFNKIVPKCEVFSVYGMTEIGAMAVTQKFDKNFCAGKLAPNIIIKIIDKNGSPVGPGCYGEILIKFNYSFLGYYGKEKLTREVHDKDGWLLSGDIGKFDEDNILLIIGRKKDALTNKGLEYYPTIIESIILEMPEVHQVCVSGVSDGEGNDLPTALVILKSGVSFSEKEIIDYTRNRLEEHTQLKGGVFFIDSIPLTYAGKFNRESAKVMAEELFSLRKLKNS